MAFELTMRYPGVTSGRTMAPIYCAASGTLVRPLFSGWRDEGATLARRLQEALPA